MRSLFLSSPGLAPSSGLRLSAQRATELVGGRPTAVLDYPLMKRQSLSVVDRQRVPFLRAQERNQRRARGAPPLRPPRRLRLACGQSRRRPVHGSIGKFTASRQPPRRGRNASARESPEPYRKCARGGAAAFAWRAAPTGRRKTARLRRARAQSARTPVPGVVFRRGFWRAIRLRSLGAPAT